MSKGNAKPTRRKAAPVVAIAGAERPQDALKRMHEILANEKPKGIIVITVGADGEVDTRLYGEFKRTDVAWAGAQLTNEAFK